LPRAREKQRRHIHNDHTARCGQPKRPPLRAAGDLDQDACSLPSGRSKASTKNTKKKKRTSYTEYEVDA
jgi:hypothetical protein